MRTSLMVGCMFNCTRCAHSMASDR
jgi:hypothetical protein